MVINGFMLTKLKHSKHSLTGAFYCANKGGDNNESNGKEGTTE